MKQKAVVAIISLFFLVTVVLLVFPRQDLSKIADAYLKLGELDSAEAFLARHILRNPNDLEARLTHARVVLELGDTSKAVRVLESIRADARPRDSLYSTGAVTTLRQLSDLAARHADSVAGELFRRGQFDSVSQYAYSAVASRRKAETLRREEGDTILSFLGKWNIAKAAARGVVSEHLAGDSGSAMNLMLRSPISIFDSSAWNSTLALAGSTVDSIASAAFDAKRWRETRRLYTFGAQLYELQNDTMEQPRMLYNAAMADWNRGRYVSARSLLAGIRDSFPHYKINQIQNMIGEAATASATTATIQQLIQMQKQASTQFDEDQWLQARQTYRRIVALVREQGVEVGEYEPRSMYNIAITYYNEQEYRQARAQLVELQRKFPSYQPDMITDVLRKLERSIR